MKLTKLLFSVLGFFLFSLNTFSQNVTEKVYSSCLFNNMLTNQDGSMTFCGSVLMKLNSDYSIRWVKSYQRPDSTMYSFDNIFSINDTAYFVSYSNHQYPAPYNYGFMLIDSAGNILSNKMIADSSQQFSGYIKDVLQENDSTYFISIWQGPTVILLKVNLQSGIIAQRAFQSYQPVQKSMIKLLDGNILFITHDLDNPTEIFNLHCLDSNLDTVWNKGYHQAPDWASLQSSWIMQLADSSIWMIGTVYPSPTQQASLSVICKFSNDGELIWNKQYKYTDFVLGSACELNGKIYAATPWFNSQGSLFFSIGITVFDTTGQILSKQTYPNGDQLYHNFLVLKNDSLLIGFNASTLGNSGYLVVDTNLSTSCSTDNLTMIIDSISPIKYNFNSYTSSTIILIDTTENYTIYSPILNENIYCVQTGTAELKNNNIQIYPNPSSEAIRIQLTGLNGEVKIHISDVFGRTVFEVASLNSNDFFVDVSQFVNGLYFTTIETNGLRQTTSFIKM